MRLTCLLVCWQQYSQPFFDLLLVVPAHDQPHHPFNLRRKRFARLIVLENDLVIVFQLQVALHQQLVPFLHFLDFQFQTLDLISHKSELQCLVRKFLPGDFQFSFKLSDFVGGVDMMLLLLPLLSHFLLPLGHHLPYFLHVQVRHFRLFLAPDDLLDLVREQNW